MYSNPHREAERAFYEQQIRKLDINLKCCSKAEDNQQRYHLWIRISRTRRSLAMASAHVRPNDWRKRTHKGAWHPHIWRSIWTSHLFLRHWSCALLTSDGPDSIEEPSNAHNRKLHLNLVNTKYFIMVRNILQIYISKHVYFLLCR
jgi:hypothetical protein